MLFEPIALGPKVARNRLFFAPHAAGSADPGFEAAYRGMRAEGGWGAVSLGITALAPESDRAREHITNLWDEGDARNLRLMVDQAHEHGALAAVELYYGGPFAAGFDGRMQGARRSPSHVPPSDGHLLPGSREISKAEIRELQGRYVHAAKLARSAGFDIICLITSTACELTHQFLLPAFNHRTDEYGGSLENRARFALETYELVREAVGDDMALTVRFGVDTLEAPEGLGDGGIRVAEDGGAFMQLADHLVDMWDLVVGWLEWGEQAGPSRTHRENWSSEIMRQAKQFTTKPVANVGRIVNPDTMAEMIASGQCDIISAARPGIADPFLPAKISQGRLDDIRECIGCNQCVARVDGGGPIICTQNATTGQEYKRGWHPEKFSAASNSDSDVLVLGAGPAGMECARVLGERGMRRVHLVDAGSEIGGSVRDIAGLPGLGDWARVINYRRIQLDKLRNVEVIPNTRLSANEAIEYGADLVIVATGSTWSATGMDMMNAPVAGADAIGDDRILTPNQVFAGKEPGDDVVIYDLDGYFMGASLAERFATEGRRVTLVTSFSDPAPFMKWTLEQPRMLRTLHRLGVRMKSNTAITAVASSSSSVSCTTADIWSQETSTLHSDTLLLVTRRLPNDDIFIAMRDDADALARNGVRAVYQVGDCAVPGFISDAIFEGHRLGREIDAPNPAYPLPYIRERRLLDAVDADYTLDSPAIALGPPATSPLPAASPVKS